MRHLLQCGVFLIPLIGAFSGCRSLPTSGRTYERSYNEEFRLSAAEERDVVALAAEMGMTQIEKIETHTGHMPIISVKETESVLGRVVSFRTITMYSKKWGEWWNLEKLAETTVSKGLILADHPKTVELTILNAGGKQYRVTLDDSVTPTSAEAILECFLAEKIRFARKLTPAEDDIHISDYSEPISIRFDKARGLHVITFTSEGTFRWSTYLGNIVGDVFVVHKVVTKQA